MSTSLNSNKIQRQIEAAKPKDILSAVFGGIDREVFSELVTSYCNGKEIGSEMKGNQPPGKATERILRGYGIDFLLFRRFERMAFLLLQITERFYLTGSDPSDEELKIIQKCARELEKSRDTFRSAVTWLCSPKEIKPSASSFKLRRLSESGRLEVGRYPLIDRNNEKFVKYFEDHGLKHLRVRASLQEQHLYLFPRYRHFVDVFCSFLLSECQSKLSREMPFKICRHCQSLFFSQRVEAEFCSDACRHKGYWSPERHRDHTYVNRLQEFVRRWEGKKFGYSDEDLRKKLLASGKRLGEIESRWQSSWPKIIEKIGTIRRYQNALR